ncbi:MAG: 3-deoxy-7-phosphoheptulonate synthase [Acholeplasmatales bacterium]|nr:3-deoxy-7-phosphoheptulonate synthase [Acholeplasmatales bacterium]
MRDVFSTNLISKQELPTPEEIRRTIPFSDDLKEIKSANDKEIRDIFTGKSNKFILIIGPCSSDREDAVIDYVKRLRKIYDKVKDVIYIIPRVYTGKPRTTGAGYKGMVHQPDPNGEPDMLKGIKAIRKLHIDVVRETGFTSADEMLYPENWAYVSDILAYNAVGARSVEDQEHRLLASGMDVPVGMKNPTSGDLNVVMNSVYAGQHPATFVYRGWEVESKGNDLTHVVLRGYVDKGGISHPNYHYEDLERVCALYKEKAYDNPAVIIDCNHSNSGKNYLEQVRIAKEVIHSMKYNEDINKLVKGLMIESYIEDGNQKTDGTVYGKSITDPCLGIEKTEKLILDLAEQIREIRK